METIQQPLYLDARAFRALFDLFGPSLGFWRAAEIAALRGVMARCGSDAAPVLDLGCGDGLVTSYVLPQVEVGLDPDARALARAARLGIYARTLPTAMESAEIPPGSIGTIISNSVLEHVTDIRGALRSAAHALRPGGRLIFTAPTEAFSRWLALPWPAYAARRNRHFEHINLLPVDGWAQLLDETGLEIEHVQPYLRPGWVRAWDWTELVQLITIRRRRLFGRVWKRLPKAYLDCLAQHAARVDLSAPPPGGGRLISAIKT